MYTYKRVVESPLYESNKYRNKGQKVLNLFHAVKWNISLGLVLASIVGFFLSRAVFWGELLPFAPAFAAATAVSYGRRGFLAVVFMCAGMATVLSGQLLATNIVLVVFSFLFANALPRKYSNRKLVIPAIIFGLTISVKSAFLAFANSTPYDYINVFFESVLAAVLVSACLVSLSSAKKFDVVQPLGGEETVCMLLLMAGIIAGTGDIQIWHISAKGLLSKIIILLAATAGGAGLGAAAGALVGIIPGMAYTVTPSLVGAHSFAGVLAGFGRSLGKIGVAIAFLASNVILTLYFNNTAVMVTVITETVVACLVLLMVPEGIIQKVSSSILREVNKGQDDYERQYMSRAFKEKLGEYSSIFRELARVFGENNPLIEKKDNEDGIKRLLSEISQKVCTGCPVYSLCWEKEYYRTYQNMLDMFTLSELYGRLKISDIPDELKLRCTRLRELAATAACLYETFKVGSYWRSKFAAGKGIVGEQLKGLSSVIDNLADVFNLEQCACENTDTTLKHKLRQLGIPVREIKIYQFNDRREIQVAMKACNGELDCRYKMAP